MKGTEGIDYVITECGHCKGNGKCNCYQCLFEAANRDLFARASGTPTIGDRNQKIEYFKGKEFEVPCSICEGIGKVVFWREGKSEDGE